MDDLDAPAETRAPAAFDSTAPASPAPSDATRSHSQARRRRPTRLPSPELARLDEWLALARRPGRTVRAVSLEIDNFKSFQTRTLIPLHDGFTAVSGPNGSGKSNLIDAVLFVLGFATSKGMRAGRLTDLLCDQTRKGFARVTLTLEIAAGAEKRQVSIARSVRKTRAGYNAFYAVEGRTVRQADLHELLRLCDLHDGGMNVVLQGDVQRLTSMGAVERRRVIDEIAGVREFDRRIDLAKEELAKAEAHMHDTNLLAGELRARLEALSKERDAALLHRRLRDAVRALEEELASLEVLALTLKRDKQQRAVAGLKETRTARDEKLGKAREALLKAKAELDAVQAELDAKGEGERLAALRALEALKAEHGAELQASKAAGEEARAVSAGDGARQKKLTKARADVAAFDEQLAALAKDLEAQESAHKDVEARFRRAVASVRKQSSAQADSALAQRELRDRQSALLTRRDAVLAELARLRESDAVARKELEVLSQGLDAQAKRREEVSRNESEAATARRIVRQDLARERQVFDRLSARSAKLREKLEQLDDKIGVADRALVAAQQKAHHLGESGSARALRVLREAGIAGVHGVARELLSYDGDVGLAIETAGAGRLDWIIVNTPEVGAECIEHLKRARVARRTFAPLSKIDPPSFDLRPVKGAGIVGYAIDLVSYDAAYEKVVRYILGDTLIIESTRIGLPLMGRHRMATLDGDLLEKRGLMSGGAVPGGAAEMRDTERAVFELEGRLKKLREERAAARRELGEAEEEARTAQERITTLRAKEGRAEQTLENALRDLKQLDDVLAPKDDRTQALQSAITQAASRVGELQPGLAEVEEELRAIAASLREPDPAADRRIAEESRDLEQRERELREACDVLREKKAVLIAQRGEAASVLAAIETEARGAAERVEALKGEAEAARTRAAALAARVESQQKEAQRIDGELAALAGKRDTLREKAEKERDRVRDLERAIESLDAQLIQAEEKLAELVAQAQERLDDLQKRGIEPNRCTSEDEAREALEAAPQIKAEIRRKEDKLKELGDVNHLAIEQYEELEARIRELQEKLTTLENEKQTLLQRMNDLEGSKKAAFMAAYESVRQAFRDSFLEVAKGEGELSLENPDAPFEGGLYIEARPSGKNFARLEALSGGEKSLTALAFIFALQSVNAAPFFVFDEVDQSLDGVNTERLAHAIERRARERQHIVISHHRAMLECASRTLGVTMRTDVGTQIVGLELAASGAA